MTIASDLGFELDKEYRVVSLSDAMAFEGIKPGDYVTFAKDDGSALPGFRYNGRFFWARIEGLPVRVVPEERPTAFRIVRNFEDTASALKPHQKVEILQTVNSRRMVSGVAVLVAPEGGDPELVCSSCVEPIPNTPDHSAKIKALEEENASIGKQVNNMLKRIDKKLSFRDDNAREIDRLRGEMQG